SLSDALDRLQPGKTAAEAHPEADWTLAPASAPTPEPTPERQPAPEPPVARTTIPTRRTIGATPTQPTSTTTTPTAGTPAPARAAPVKSLALLTLAAMDKEAAAALRATRGFGAGLNRLGKARPELAANPVFVQNLVQTGRVAELDTVARTARGEAFTSLVDEVSKAGLSDSRAAPRALAATINRLASGGEQ
ncbi:MAG TPA: hypothetical protein VEY93_01815, partial [Longimicrobium sp.]|nr:hypothetical protein [Longimicrobium sp.]